MTAEQRKQIDGMSYEKMFRLWRHADTGHPFFSGRVGDYFIGVMKAKRKKIGEEMHAKISKKIGW